MTPAILTTLGYSIFTPVLAVMSLWYALPLVVSVSLVCAATRHEEISVILNHAIRFGVWILVFMAVVMGLLTLVDAMA